MKYARSSSSGGHADSELGSRIPWSAIRAVAGRHALSYRYEILPPRLLVASVPRHLPVPANDVVTPQL
jgi:hypothetical protein